MTRLRIAPNRLFYWRTKDGKEVDFIIDRGDSLIAAECKVKAMPDSSDERGLNAFISANPDTKILKAIICSSKGYLRKKAAGLIIDNGTGIEKLLAEKV